MASQPIITDYKELSSRSLEIGISSHRDEVNQIIKELKDTIIENNLTHLTASQIGYDKRIFCIDFNGEIHTFINSVIVKMEEPTISREHCASLKNDYLIPRHKEIVAMYQTPTGKTESNRFMEPASCIFEQCQDLLDGVLLSDYGLEITPEFDNATAEEQEEVLKWYFESLNDTLDKLNAEIESDDMLRQTRDAIDFMGSVIKGETSLEPIEEKPVKLNRATKRLIKKKLKHE